MKTYRLKKIKISAVCLLLFNAPAYAMLATQVPKKTIESALDIKNTIGSLSKDSTSYLSLIKDTTALKMIPCYQLGTECQELSKILTEINIEQKVQPKLNSDSLQDLETYFSALVESSLAIIGSKEDFFKEAVCHDDLLSVIQDLIKKGVDINQPDEENQTNENDLKFYLAEIQRNAPYGVKIVFNRTRPTPLHRAITHRNIHGARILLQAGANSNQPDKNGDTPLHDAAFQNNVDALQVLLAAGADPDKINKNGWTPLLKATWTNSDEAAEVLLTARANVQLADIKDGDTPLLMAATHNFESIVRLLLAAKAPVDQANNHGITPLDAAAYNDHVDVLQALLDAGATPDQPNNRGRTPLYTAANRGHKHSVKILLKAKADLNEALRVAESNNDTNAIQLLLSQKQHPLFKP